MEAFSDGVFAIAVTLLVLEIAVPAGSGNDLLGALRDQWPSYLAYFVSFATIGAVWFAHTVITEYLDHADSVLIRLNLLLLLVVSFLPFPTKLLAEYVHQVRSERIAATVYGINLLLAMIMVSVTWRYAVRAHLVHPGPGRPGREDPDQAAHTNAGLVRRDDPRRPVPACRRFSATWRSPCSSSYRSGPSDTGRVRPDPVQVAADQSGTLTRAVS